MDPLTEIGRMKRAKSTQRELALEKLGLTFDPPSVKLDMTLREVTDGGFKDIMEQYVPLLAESNVAYETLLDLYTNSDITDRDQHLRPEDYLAAAGLPIGQFLGEITTVAYDTNAAVAAMMAAIAQPKVIKATIKAATDPKMGSVKDRENLLKITKMLPTAGAGVVIQNFGGGATKISPGEVKVESGDEGFLKFEHEARENAKDMRVGEGRKLLEAATEYVEAEFEDVEE